VRKTGILVFCGVLGLLALFGWNIFADRPATIAAEPSALRSGRLATDFTITLFSGEGFNLAEQRGKPVMVNFWASWCPPCRDEAPVLERAWRAFKDRGVVFVGVDVWDAEADARAFVQRYDITYPNGPDPSGEVAIEYGVTGLPETWFLDREGRLVRRWVGALNDRQITAFLEEAMR
jgi:cytochrome c biogenesis protein CcmG/thiol:disulfide interchange protein DsbE